MAGKFICKIIQSLVHLQYLLQLDDLAIPTRRTCSLRRSGAVLLIRSIVAVVFTIAGPFFRYTSAIAAFEMFRFARTVSWKDRLVNFVYSYSTIHFNTLLTAITLVRFISAIIIVITFPIQRNTFSIRNALEHIRRASRSIGAKLPKKSH